VWAVELAAILAVFAVALRDKTEDPTAEAPAVTASD
jgi:hypothetical protein